MVSWDKGFQDMYAIQSESRNDLSDKSVSYFQCRRISFQIYVGTYINTDAKKCVQSLCVY